MYLITQGSNKKFMCYRHGVWFLLLGLSSRSQGQKDGPDSVAAGGRTQRASVQRLSVLLRVPRVQVSEWFRVSFTTSVSI